MAKEDEVMQDNKICISLNGNYPHSIGKCSKHSHIMCFFVVNKIDEIEV